MNGDPVYRRSDVLWRRTFDRVVILVPTTGELVTLTNTGCDLWAVLEQPGRVAELAERLAAVYAAPAEQVGKDIAATIEQLWRIGAVAATGREP